jgi:hypothetical protein
LAQLDEIRDHYHNLVERYFNKLEQFRGIAI